MQNLYMQSCKASLEILSGENCEHFCIHLFLNSTRLICKLTGGQDTVTPIFQLKKLAIWPSSSVPLSISAQTSSQSKGQNVKRGRK